MSRRRRRTLPARPGARASSRTTEGMRKPSGMSWLGAQPPASARCELGPPAHAALRQGSG
eukprot:9269367-Pyramimonas_sp.AAC.1